MTQNRFDHGLIIGKFYPPHSGHDHLIRHAVRACRRVTVEVIGSSAESIPVEDRATWLRETHPTVRVVTEIDDTPVDYDSPAAWEAHTATIRGLLDAPADAVFTSDAYGKELARRLDATWVRIDPQRTLNPISGTAVRADLAAWWPELSSSVRAGLSRRIVVLGAESTGSTTLTARLAEHYGTVWVPEYGREYSAVRPGGLAAPWRSDEFDLVVDRQLAAERRTARRSPTPFLLCDTDVLATSVWHERYVGTCSPRIALAAALHQPLLYLLTGDEIPFVDDGLRDGEHLRHRMQQRFREVLSAQPVPWLEVRGSADERLAAASARIDEVVSTAFTFAIPLEQRGSTQPSTPERPK